MSELASFWNLDPGIDYLNHGSFGACPRAVLEEQTRLRGRLEEEAVRFYIRELPDLLEAARAAVGDFVGADPEGVVLIPNATIGVNSALQSIPFEPGDELVMTDHEYNACRNIAEFVTERAGARVVIARIPYPIESPDQAAAAVLDAITDRTRVVLVDHITSQTGMVLPLEELVPAIRARGPEVVVDGAHAPGQVPLDLEALGASWYTGNCHKWMCAPKAAAVLWTRADLRDMTRPAIISHGANAPLHDKSRYHLEFDWLGTVDPTAWLCLPRTIEHIASMVEGGWPAVMRRNHELALEARRLVADAVGADLPCPDSMVGSMATVPLPDGDPEAPPGPFDTDALQDALLEAGIEVPINPWPAWPGRVIRLSAQLYNDRGQYERLARELAAALERS